MVIIGDEIISGFIGEAISRCVDFSWTKIKEAVKNRKNKHQNIESQIYNVVVNVLNQITYNKFENDQDKIYQAAEKLLICYKDSRCDSIEVVKPGLQTLNENVNNDKYMEFKTLLYQELSKDDYEELYHQIRLLQQNEESNKTLRIEHSVNEVREDVREIKQVVLNEKNADVESSSTIMTKFQNNKKQKYIENWNSRLFLHTDDEKNPITLSDAFIVPKFDCYIKIGSIKFSDKDLLTGAIEKFIQCDKTSNLLITGMPGIGKTSIISWIADKYKDDEDIIILRFRDWSNKDLAKGLFNAVCNTLDCESSDLENKVLIIDGFDEIKSVNERKSLILEFLNNILDFDNLKIIITSRPNYLDTSVFRNVFKILPFDRFQIKQFYNKIKHKELNEEKIDFDNLDILGIPVILYMAIMSDINLTLKITRPQLYSHIFAEKGGIFDRFHFREIGYDNGSQPLRDEENVRKYLNFLQKVAFSMFEKDDLTLTKHEYQIPKLKFQGQKLKVVEFPIKPFFERTEYNIEFIHKSLYEYFVAEYIYKKMCEIENKSEEEIAGTFGCLLKLNVLSSEILEYLKFKINKKFIGNFDFVYSSFQLMVRDGMTYYTKKNYKNIIDCEMKVFVNMLGIVHLWSRKYPKTDQKIGEYIRYNKKYKLNLAELDLSQINLNSSFLKGANLSGANLSNTYLMEANLMGANLRVASLDRAYLTNANLYGADLYGANLSNTYLCGAHLGKVNLDKAYLNETILSEEQIEKMENHINLRNVKVSTKELKTIDYYNRKQ